MRPFLATLAVCMLGSAWVYAAKGQIAIPALDRDSANLHASAAPFVEAGFAPIEDVTEPRRDVRRLLLRDPYFALGTPGIEIERYRDGRSVLRLQYPAWRGPTRPLAAATWDQLDALEAQAFPVPVPQTTPHTAALTSPPPPPICHGWVVRYLSGSGRTGAWGECGGNPEDEAYHYTAILLEAALSTAPSCQIDQKNLFWSYQNCFGSGNKLDDPVLNEKYTALVKIYSNSEGSNILAAARAAVEAPDIVVGNDAWHKARDAVARLKLYNETQENGIRKLQALAWEGRSASDSDQFAIKSLLMTWRDFQAAQWANYADVLDRLVWADGTVPSAR